MITKSYKMHIPAPKIRLLVALFHGSVSLNHPRLFKTQIKQTALKILSSYSRGTARLPGFPLIPVFVYISSANRKQELSD